MGGESEQFVSRERLCGGLCLIQDAPTSKELCTVPDWAEAQWVEHCLAHTKPRVLPWRHVNSIVVLYPCPEHKRQGEVQDHPRL